MINSRPPSDCSGKYPSPAMDPRTSAPDTCKLSDTPADSRGRRCTASHPRHRSAPPSSSSCTRHLLLKFSIMRVSVEEELEQCARREDTHKRGHLPISIPYDSSNCRTMGAYHLNCSSSSYKAFPIASPRRLMCTSAKLSLSAKLSFPSSILLAVAGM